METTRRGLIATAFALPASWAAFTRNLHAATALDDAYWRMVQRQFPLEDNLLYLNAANVCPASRPVMDRHLEYLRDFHANPSFQNRDKYAALRENLRQKAARLLRVTADEIAVTHVTSTTGILYPAREVAELARRKNIWMHLDGAQSFGCLDVDLAAIPCDSYSTSAHKWLMGPLEAGLLFVRAGRIAELWPSIVTAGWADDLKGARKFEVFGQRDGPRVVALEASLDFVSLIGMANVEARARALASRAKAGLKAIGSVELKTNLQPELSAGVVKFKLRNKATKAAYDKLWQRHRLAIASTLSGDSEGLRFSPHIYNSFEQVDAAVAAVKELAG